MMNMSAVQMMIKEVSPTLIISYHLLEMGNADAPRAMRPLLPEPAFPEK
jgi:hypothetical protein